MKKRDLVTMIESVEQTVGMLRGEVDDLAQQISALRSEVDGIDGKHRTMTEDASNFGHRISMLENAAQDSPWCPPGNAL